MPKKAPTSIMPSSPMLTTPERSETTPPSAAKTSGVAKRSIAAASADQTTTRSRLPSPDCGGGDRADRAQHAADDRSPAEPALALADDPDAEADRGQREHHRRHRRAHEQRRQRDPERQEAEHDRAPAHEDRALDAPHVEAVAGQRRGAHAPGSSSGLVRRGRSL